MSKTLTVKLRISSEEICLLIFVGKSTRKDTLTAVMKL